MRAAQSPRGAGVPLLIRPSRATIGWALQAIRAAIQRVVGNPDQPDLSLRQVRLLLLLGSQDAQLLSVGQIAHTMNVGKPVVTRGLTRLEELRMAVRCPPTNTQDNRLMFAQITPAGRDYLTEMAAALLEEVAT